MEPNQDPRLDEIIARLARLERFVGLPRAEQSKSRPHAPKPVNPPVAPGVPPPLQSIEQRPGADLRATPTARDVATSQGAIAHADAAEGIARSEASGASENRHTPRDPADHARAASARVREQLRERAATGVKKSMADVERLIGGRWYAVVGAVVLVIGVGMGLKWAYDAGLLRLPPAMRCLSGGVFGAVLIGAGSWLRKRVNDWAAVGATAAGLGSMYVSVLTAYKLFTLLPPAGAFAMLAGVSLLGIVISVQSRLVAVAIVSLVAGYITPLMFLDVQSSPLRFALYLLMLLTTGLGVSAWQGRAFASLRTLAWSGTLVWGTVWTLASARHELWLAISFLAAVWCLLHAELLWAAKNTQLALPVAEDPDAPPSEPTPRSNRDSRWSTWRPVTISISATFWGVTLGYTVLNANLWPTWPAPAAALLACGAIWLLTAFHLDIIRQRPTSDLEVLGVVAAIQIGGLLLTTIALAFGGPTQVVTWLLLAVAAAAASTRLGARAIFYYALIPAVIATLRLVLWDAWRGGWHTGG
ncbi:MAG: DUF2339 domain-containing protein, partial [Phycisphaerae bacterium]|nr:DUF2339 domain-containing protein [Phycisphaerae bacterium]